MSTRGRTRNVSASRNRTASASASRTTSVNSSRTGGRGWRYRDLEPPPPEPEAMDVDVDVEYEAGEESLDDKRARMLEEKQAALERAFDYHDTLVRELFHMENFRMMLDYDPQVAKQESTQVFLEYKEKYDLYEKAAPAPPSRKTRSARSERRQGVAASASIGGPSESIPWKTKSSISAPIPSSASMSKSKPRKGKSSIPVPESISSGSLTMVKKKPGPKVKGSTPAATTRGTFKVPTTPLPKSKSKPGPKPGWKTKSKTSMTPTATTPKISVSMSTPKTISPVKLITYKSKGKGKARVVESESEREIESEDEDEDEGGLESESEGVEVEVEPEDEKGDVHTVEDEEGCVNGDLDVSMAEDANLLTGGDADVPMNEDMDVPTNVDADKAMSGMFSSGEITPFPSEESTPLLGELLGDDVVLPDDAMLLQDGSALLPDDSTLLQEDSTLLQEDSTLLPEDSLSLPEDLTLVPDDASLPLDDFMLLPDDTVLPPSPSPAPLSYDIDFTTPLDHVPERTLPANFPTTVRVIPPLATKPKANENQDRDGDGNVCAALTNGGGDDGLSTTLSASVGVGAESDAPPKTPDLNVPPEADSQPVNSIPTPDRVIHVRTKLRSVPSTPTPIVPTRRSGRTVSSVSQARGVESASVSAAGAGTVSGAGGESISYRGEVTMSPRKKARIERFNAENQERVSTRSQKHVQLGGKGVLGEKDVLGGKGVQGAKTVHGQPEKIVTTLGDQNTTPILTSRIKRVKLIVHRPPRALTNPQQRAKPALHKESLSEFLDSYRTLCGEKDKDVSEANVQREAVREAKIRERVEAFGRAGRFVPGTEILFGMDRNRHKRKRDEEEEEDEEEREYVSPQRNTRDPWDDIVESIPKRKAPVRGRKIANTIAGKIQGYWDGQSARVQRARAEEEKRVRVLAKKVMNEVVGEWKKAVFHVREKEREAKEKEEVRRGHEHLDAILDQSGYLLNTQQGDLSRARRELGLEEDGDDEDEDEGEDDEDKDEDEEREEEDRDTSDIATTPSLANLVGYGSDSSGRSSPLLANDADASASEQIDPSEVDPSELEPSEADVSEIPDTPDIPQHPEIEPPEVTELPEIPEIAENDLTVGPPSPSHDDQPEKSEQPNDTSSQIPHYLRPYAVAPVTWDPTAKITPPPLLRGVLRPYQQSGLEWLASLHLNNLNGILADEMGLGKTIQTISLLAHLACDRGIWGPHLIIVPTSVLLNWEMEFKKFLPGFTVLSYHGSTKRRKELRHGWYDAHTFNVCITSYTLASRDAHIFKRKPWYYMVLDEAHMIKNFRSQRWGILLMFRSFRRLLLTGTPLQNNLTELWALLQFLMSGSNFANLKEFGDWFSNPLEKAIEQGTTLTDDTLLRVTKLHTVLRPYILRRLKSSVEKELPKKHAHLLLCSLSKRQQFLYDEFMSRAGTRDALRSGVYQKIANVLMQLRKVCNHPDLFEVRDVKTSFVARAAVAEWEVKELLIRRRVLGGRQWWEEDLRIGSAGSEEMRRLDLDTRQNINLDFLNLRFIEVQDTPFLATLETRRLDASADIVKPYLSLTPSLSPPPQHDTRTIAGFRAYSAYQASEARLSAARHRAYVNTLRCATMPVYGSECVRLVRGMYTPLVGLDVGVLDEDEVWFGNDNQNTYTFPDPRIMPPDTRLAHLVSPSTSASMSSSSLAPRALRACLTSYRAREKAMRSVIETFACVTPTVVVREMPRFVFGGVTGEEKVWSILHSGGSIQGLRSQPGVSQSKPSPPIPPLALSLTSHLPTTPLLISFPHRTLLQYDCGKLQSLALLLRSKHSVGSRALIFTQMTKVLDILEAFLNLHGWLYLRLDGATRVEERQYVTERFNVDKRVFCFIASSRSGGVGINLTGADTVIFYDSDFNPQMDKQCEDRAHRIGQMRDVHIYRFVSAHTVEEAMLHKANQKRHLDELVIQRGEFDWRGVLGDVEGEGDMESTGAGTGTGTDDAIERALFASDEASLTRALGEVEDREDAHAAEVAAREDAYVAATEAVEFEADGDGDEGVADENADENGDVDESARVGVNGGMPDAAVPDTPVEDNAPPDEDEDEGEAEGGTVVEHMLTVVERDWEYFRGWRV